MTTPLPFCSVINAFRLSNWKLNWTNHKEKMHHIKHARALGCFFKKESRYLSVNRYLQSARIEVKSRSYSSNSRKPHTPIILPKQNPFSTHTKQYSSKSNSINIYLPPFSPFARSIDTFCKIDRSSIETPEETSAQAQPVQKAGAWASQIFKKLAKCPIMYIISLYIYMGCAAMFHYSEKDVNGHEIFWENLVI